MARKFEKILLNRNHSSIMMGVNPSVFSSWQLEPEIKKGVEVFYDLQKVIEFRISMLSSPIKSSGLTEARTEVARLQAAKSKIQLDAMKGKYIETDIVEDVWSEHIAKVRARLLSIPTNAARELTASKNIRITEKKLRTHINKALNELSKSDKERHNKNSVISSSKSKKTLPATKSVKSKPVGRSKKSS